MDLHLFNRFLTLYWNELRQMDSFFSIAKVNISKKVFYQDKLDAVV